jgi:epoxide hydrolase-like predicted phosphatase
VPVQAVIFDIGDVLEVNPRTGWSGRWADRLRIDADAFARCLDRIWSPGAIGAVTLVEIEKQTAEALGLDQTTITAMMEDVWAEYVGSLNRELARYFASLRPRYKTAILSNSFVGAREREQEAYGFHEMCDVIVYSHEVGWLKPDARIYHLVCDLLEVAPEEAVLVDDVQANVDGAKAVGMRGIRFANNAQAIVELGAHLTA